jgi:class 3 adenylate cyclase
MSLMDDLGEGIEEILASEWDVRQGRVVPGPEDVTLLSGGVEIDATVLFSDLAESSLLSTGLERKVAAKVFKAFHLACTRIITSHEGSLTGWDGDRVMGVFMGEFKDANAVTAALKINFVVTNLLSPKLRSHFQSLEHFHE